MSEQDQVDKYPSMTLGDNENNKRVVEKASIGVQLKAIRTENKLTLEEASKRTGLARSTLSKIENEQISPTFSVMQKLASGLNIELPQLFTKPKETKVTGRRDVTLGGQGRPHATLTYEHELLATQLRNKKMMPYKSRVHARNFEHFGEWVRHEGEEFLLVLEGEVQLLTEFYEPATLVVGDSAYYDATMGHLVISTSKEDALILWITAE
ncbi:helix-turn-helix domain-containing protein [Colwellia psychrerythraea]|uniref:Transcriptional regulator, XRE family with cupin 2 sensor n=1 Tax=Colwellia psychrerythraea TaxID=28229 RepID=A0A099KRT7_COLPS|nr:XRE family transcriptional regulator [Colwellia psychrerythraea]KGJ93226.1 transcriptional regulator, XRE family with cupin 2 sensor [Colwellia psychrerythraea]